MELLEIQDSRDKVAETKKICAVGIDFGTTNSLVSYSLNRNPEILLNEEGNELTKSILKIDEVNLKSIKRLVGKSYDEIAKSDYLQDNYKKILVNKDGKIKLSISEKLYSPVEIVAEILKKIKNYATIRIGTEIEACVLTVPAYFDETAKNEMKFAAKLAGLNVLRLLSEPTAACYSYGLNDKKEGYYLIYDFGGGTFDVSLINMKMGVFKVIATDGDNLLGGDDLDIAFRKYLSKDFDSISLEIVGKLKEELSEKEEIIYLGKKISRADFHSSISELINRTIRIVSNLLLTSGINIKDILGIVLVGGSSKISLVQQRLKEKFKLPLFTDKDPETIVALGAGLVAENLTFKNNNLILDVVPLSIGIETYGGFMERMIERNSTIPCSVKKQYTNYADNQTAMKFHILQGEREMAKDCRSIGFFELKNIPPMKAQMAKIEVLFTVDVDGLISIEAIDTISKNYEKIEIQQTYGISNDEIDQMLRNAYQNLEKDHNERLLLESELKAKDLIKSINSIISDLSKEIEEDKIDSVLDSIADLENSISDRELMRIKSDTKKLKEISNFLVEMKLNRDILSVIKGKNINDI
jgi:molecular chaperone HscA